MSRQIFPSPRKAAKKEEMTAYLPDNKGMSRVSGRANYTEWNEYLNSVQDPEIPDPGVVRVTPVPRQITPIFSYQVCFPFYSS